MGKRILIVDDNRDGAESLSMLFSVLGHEPVVAFSGEEGLAKFRESAPEFVFLDIGLPDIDGYEVCRRIRNLPHGASAALVAITGWGGEEDKKRAREAGFDAHLTKPVELSQVEDFIKPANEAPLPPQRAA
jgi:CheY-like chemotaxis protein